VPADDFAAVFIGDRGDDDFLGGAVDGFQRAIEIAIAPAIGVAAIADFIEVGIERASGDFVEQRLPDVRVRGIGILSCCNAPLAARATLPKPHGERIFAASGIGLCTKAKLGSGDDRDHAPNRRRARLHARGI
jgi:hypothetical protein